jgi:hypothetical protein
MRAMDASRPLGIRTMARYRVADEARVVAMLVMYGWTTDVRQGRALQAEREAAAMLERWIAMGLAYERGPDGARRFDIAEVLNFARGPARHRGDRGYERLVRQARMLLLGFHPAGASPDAPPRPDTLPPERFTVTLLREFTLDPATPRSKLLLRLPMPIEDTTLSDVLFDVIAPPGTDPEVTIAPGRLDVRLSAPAAPTIVVGARWSFISDPARAGRGGERLDDDEHELYTRPAEGIVKVTPRIRALADELAGDEGEPFAIVRRYVDHMVEKWHLSVVHYDELDPAAPTDWVLDTGWFDCQMGCALVVAMCRARGIPARLVSGLQLTPAPAGHYWFEAWFDERGWTPFDLNVCDLSVRGRDAAWRDYYVGAIDYRMKTQVLPRTFNLTPSIRFPKAWHVLARLTDDGARSTTYDDASGAVVYDDRVSVQRGDDPPGSLRTNATPL